VPRRDAAERCDTTHQRTEQTAVAEGTRRDGGSRGVDGQPIETERHPDETIPTPTGAAAEDEDRLVRRHGGRTEDRDGEVPHHPAGLAHHDAAPAGLALQHVGDTYGGERLHSSFFGHCGLDSLHDARHDGVGECDHCVVREWHEHGRGGGGYDRQQEERDDGEGAHVHVRTRYSPA
jgi:hypothetical protein